MADADYVCIRPPRCGFLGWLTTSGHRTPRRLPVGSSAREFSRIAFRIYTVARREYLKVEIGGVSDFELTYHFWITELKKKRTFRKFSYRGIDLDQYVQPRSHSRKAEGLIEFLDSSTYPLNNSATSFTPAPAADSTEVSSASLWDSLKSSAKPSKKPNPTRSPISSRHICEI